MNERHKVMKHQEFEGSAEDVLAYIQKPAKRRLSLEQKLLRLVRRYRAAEKRRLRKPARTAGCRRRNRRRPNGGREGAPSQQTSNLLERAARVPKSNTLVRVANATVAPVAPGLVAGLLSVAPFTLGVSAAPLADN